MTISLGQSQSLTGTWKVTSIAVGPNQGTADYFSLSVSSGERACFFDDQYIFSDNGTFQNVQGTETWVEGWQGGSDSCGTPVAPHNGSNAATFSSTASTLTLSGVGAYIGLAKAINGSEINSPSLAPSSITYQIGSLTATTLALDINVGGAWWRFTLAKQGAVDTTPQAPNPTIAAANIIGLYTDAYPSLELAAVDTFRTSWSAATLENVVLSGNNTLKYTNLSYVGIETVTSTIDASGMNLFHIDMYTPNMTSFSVKLVDFGADGAYGGGDDKEHQINLTPTQNSWNSYNLLLSDFTGLTSRAHIAQIILVGNNSGTAYVDNMYFGNAVITVAPAISNFTIPAKVTGDADFAITAPTSTSPGAFTYSSSNTDVATIVGGSSIHIVGIGTTTITATQAASGNYTSGTITASFVVTAPIAQAPTTAAPTPPTRNAWDVVSLFSGAYSNVTLNELPTDWSQLSEAFEVLSVDGNSTWKFKGEFLGMVTNYGSGVNLAQMTTMHIDYWTPDTNRIDVKLVNTVVGGESFTALENPTVAGTWRSIDVPLSNYGALNRSNITQILVDPAGTSKIYIDNFYFYRPETNNPAPTITNFTVPSKLVDAPAFTLTAPTSNSTGAFTYTSSNTAVATISGSTVTVVGAGVTIITATQAATGSYSSGSIAANLVVSFPPPTTAASTPTVPSDRVLSIFSDAYTNEGGASYPYWGQPAGYIAPATVQIGTPGNNTLLVDNLSYQGVQLTSNINVSAMTTLHVDIWTPNCTTFEFSLIDSAPVGVPPAEQAVSVSLTQNGWNSIDIPMSSYNTLALNDVQQFKLVGTPAGSVVYLDNIYFTRPTPRNIAPTTTAVVNYCKGAVATALTATGFGGALKWYTGTTSTAGVTTYGAASSTAPIPATTAVGTKKYRVAQVLSNGTISTPADITVNVLALPTEVLGAITSNTAGTTAGTYAAATLAVGQYVGTSTQVSYRIPPFTGTGLTYYWTVPTGVTIVSQTDNVLTVNFLNVSSGIGTVGALTVQAQNASGCRTAVKSITLTKVLPTAPAAIKMTDAALPVPASGIATAVTSFAKYMGTSSVLTLTATPSTTAISYDWELPTGVTQLSGGNSNIITVDFSGVTSSNTSNYTTTTGISTNVLRIGVKSRNGVGVSTTSNTALLNPTTTSTAKLLTLTAIAPAAPGAIKMTDEAISSVTAVTIISKYVGTNTPLKLSATASALASSYEWELPTGVNVVSGNPLTDREITVKFNGVGTGVTSYYIGVKAKNGIGYSVTNNAALVPSTTSTAKLLKVTTSLPAAVTVVSGQIAGLCGGNTYTYTITPSVLANSYTVVAPAGAEVNFTSTLVFTVTYPAGFTVSTATTVPNKSLVITSVNGVGNSATTKVLTLTTAMAAIGTVTGGTTYSSCNQTFSIPAVVGASTYTWTVPAGATIVSGHGTTSVVVNYGSLTGSQTIKVLATNACGVSSALKSVTLTSGACPNAKQSEFNSPLVNEVKLYPNPATNVFNVELNAAIDAEMEMTVYSMNGSLVNSKNIQVTEGNNTITEDISSLSTGIYFVKFTNTSSNETIIKKLIKE